MKKVPYIPDSSIENRVMERLIASGMMPTPKSPILDLEAFIQGPLDAVFDEYAELPPEVMGEIVFEPGCKDHIKINRDLSELADNGMAETAITAQARRRSTTAHEAGHAILHRDILMPAVGQAVLFETDNTTPAAYAHRCHKTDFGRVTSATARRPVMRTQGDITSRDVDCLEIQANKAMAALLLPREIFCPFALEPLQQWEARRGYCDDNDHFLERRYLIRDIAEHFLVSRQVVEIRIKTLQLSAQSQQAALF